MGFHIWCIMVYIALRVKVDPMLTESTIDTVPRTSHKLQKNKSFLCHPLTSIASLMFVSMSKCVVAEGPDRVAVA